MWNRQKRIKRRPFEGRLLCEIAWKTIGNSSSTSPVEHVFGKERTQQVPGEPAERELGPQNTSENSDHNRTLKRHQCHIQQNAS